ncbi:hypothetical protein [Crocosphaera watsonii]|nr:hypothetical protein [Crocosphaera watsonii]
MKHFLQGLLTAINTVNKFTVIITLRADFLGYLLDSVQWGEWGELLQKYSPEYITSMNRQELKSAIIDPAAFNGVKLKDKLVDQLIDDVHKEKGYLPLLQFTLTELWEQQKKGLLTYEDYQEIGGVKTDQNNNNIIDEGEENAIPCETLIQIEKLWRNATDNQCGWYGKDNVWESNCQLLEGNTLTTILMYPSDIPLLENRLDYCKIKLNTKPLL